MDSLTVGLVAVCRVKFAGETRDGVASLYPTAGEARIICAIVDAAAKVRDLNFKYQAEGKGVTVTARFGPDGITLRTRIARAKARRRCFSGFMSGRFERERRLIQSDGGGGISGIINSTSSRKLVVIAIIAVLAGMLPPVLSKAKAKGQGTLCLNNMKQLALGFNLYHPDHNGKIMRRGSWGGVAMSTAANFTDNTNTTKMVSSSVLAPYVSNNLKVFKCPADRSYDTGNRIARIRSVSMNQGVGENTDAEWQDFNTAGGLVRPSALYMRFQREEDFAGMKGGAAALFV